MDKALVSVIIPVFNGVNYLGEAIESVLAQTYAPIEVLVVDDGSTDESAELARSFGGVRVIQKANGGVASARNAGIAEARGDFLAFLDHDDVHYPTKTELQMHALHAHPEAMFVLCHKRYVLVGEPPSWFRGPRDGTPVQGFVPSCWLVRREAFSTVGLFDERYSHGPDYDWLARAKDLSVSHVMLPETLVDYRVHGSNDSGNATAVTRDMMRLLRESLQRRKGESG